jgi:hypothetical protein
MAINSNFTRIDREQAIDGVKKSSFATSARSYDGDELSFFHLQIDCLASEHRFLIELASIDNRDVTGADFLIHWLSAGGG